MPLPTWTGIAAFDLDGTLLGSGGWISDEDLRALGTLGRERIFRVVATGRSPFSLERALAGRELPADAAILSSGAVILQWPSRRVLRRFVLTPREVAAAAAVLAEVGLDYMIHAPEPDNHRFAWRRAGAGSPDFLRRIDLYREHSWPLVGDPASFGPATQLVAVGAGRAAADAAARIRRALPGLSVIRTTSPLDHASVWVEILPGGVDKGAALAWLAGERGIAPGDVLAVGNDYNDLHLLRYAGTAFVVANAPDALRAEFPVVPSNEESGVAEAVRRWLAGRRPDPDPAP
jgi:hypothetical protein